MSDRRLVIYMTGRLESIDFRGTPEQTELAHDALWKHLTKHGMNGWVMLFNDIGIDMSKVDLFYTEPVAASVGCPEGLSA